MEVKVKSNLSVNVEIEYPKLMVCLEDLEDSDYSEDPLIVLFANENHGIVISGHNADEFRGAELNGDFDWGSSDYKFVPFIGEIALVSKG